MEVEAEDGWRKIKSEGMRSEAEGDVRVRVRAVLKRRRGRALTWWRVRGWRVEVMT